ncbi:hypothetical protein BKA58DRAFT_459613 [Alternaria rosae]|uniref:uncharacterized protein n=1 Tax=Alternaria rosae TaxID=1187941 RepID=UPI001E8EA801|nr:uncharacterized protein BKA58DRAFT_459613 [Alternaria rosae]KAH6868683.1 hypothetical protein BKA58DRAFT_459613 [Alternaria rosae]
MKDYISSCQLSHSMAFFFLPSYLPTLLPSAHPSHLTMSSPGAATAPHVEIGTKATPAKRPRGRPRRDGLPAGSVPKKPKTLGRARAGTATEIPGQHEKRGPGRPPKKNKSLGAQNALAAPSSSDPSPPMNPIPSRGPQDGTFTVFATVETSSTQVLVSPPSDVTVGSEETDRSQQRVQDTLRFCKEAERNQEIDVAISQWNREREDDALDFELRLFKSSHEHEVERNRLLVARMNEEDKEAEQEIGTEESKRRAERRRQKRECRDYGCYEEDCRIHHAVRANVTHFMANLDERTQALRPMVVRTDDEAAGVGKWPMIFDYPGCLHGDS